MKKQIERERERVENTRSDYGANTVQRQKEREKKKKKTMKCDLLIVNKIIKKRSIIWGEKRV